MKTRPQYLNKECSHSEYYAQFVTQSVVNLVERTFTIEVLKSAHQSDKHFNSIPLYKWDNIATFVNSGVLMKECGDFLTLSGQICILKEAARQLVQG
jgi:hypothetical protein